MKKQSIFRIVIVAVIASAAFFVMANTVSTRESSGKEDCTADKKCEDQAHGEFFLESLTRSLLTR